MKVLFNDGFKIQLVAETQLERLFMMEWERLSRVAGEDPMRMQDYKINPEFIDWEFRPSEASK